MADYPRIPSFKTTESFRSHLREINLDLELDDAILAAPESPARAAGRIPRPQDRQPLVHPADGGVGLPARRRPLRTDPAALAQLRRERRETAFRLRSVRGDGVRPQQHPPADDHPRDHAAARTVAQGHGQAARRKVRHRRRSLYRLAADPLRPLQPSARRREARIGDRLRTSAA